MSDSGSQRAEEFVQLSSAHQRQLLGYIFTLVRNMDDAEDLLQQTNLILWRRFDDYRPGTDFMRWACYVAHLQSLTFIRRRRRAPLHLDEELLQKLADRRLDRGKLYERYREVLQLCMERLNETDRELLCLFYSGALNTTEIAERFSRSAGSIYHSLQRIRRVLFDCVTQKVAKEDRQ